VGWIWQWGRWTIVLGALLLTGCLQYDLDLQFDSQTHGQIVQQISWRNGAIAQNATLQPWLQLLTERAAAVGGQVRLRDEEGFILTIPFNNGRELQTQFNQFFHPSETELPLTLPDGEPIRAELSLQQGNWLLAIRNHLSLQIDLTAVPIVTAPSLPLLQGAQLLTGTVSLSTPWGVSAPASGSPAVDHWSLVAGEVTQIDADFWIPSPIGIGALAIALLVLVGYGLKYGRWGK